MKTPSTTVELAGAIESLIGSYVDGVREAARQAVERALVRSAAGHPTRSGKKAFSGPPTSTSRRTAAELAEVCDVLCEVVRAHAGASMATLAEKIGTEAQTLLRPMATLKSTGRVRSVGQRHLTRYYPAVIRSAAGKD
jgi:hypothetical protein